LSDTVHTVIKIENASAMRQRIRNSRRAPGVRVTGRSNNEYREERPRVVNSEVDAEVEERGFSIIWLFEALMLAWMCGLLVTTVLDLCLNPDPLVGSISSSCRVPLTYSSAADSSDIHSELVGGPGVGKNNSSTADRAVNTHATVVAW
jgi:hypothetical protein